MQWKNRRQSSNVEDRRGMGVGGGIAIGGGATLVIALLVMLMGGDPQQVLEQLGGAQPGGTTTGAAPGEPGGPPDDPHQAEQKEFMSVVLADTEDVWGQLFGEMGRTYQQPKLVIFSGQVDSACGMASAAVGPFYCPGDQQLYLDLTFLDQMDRQLGASGDFAEAYVIAHEVGHHVQNLLGLMRPLDEARARGASEKTINELSVRAELQADFLAGVWAHYAQQTKGVLDPGDIEEALNAANSIGDDTLQKQAQGYAVPDSFTHGTSAQRVRWFRKGYETGDLRQGDTFSAKSL
jgi:predicted metalloprotease